jgi:VWFA-related protein
VIVYPIRFDTRADTERLARQQAAEQNGGQLPTSSILRRGQTTGTTPTTFPSEESPVPAGRPRSPLPIPGPDVIFGRRRNPNPNDPISRDPDPNRRAPPQLPPSTSEDPKKHDTISGMLDNLFLMADSYLAQLAERSGGQVYRADNVGALPQAFAAIAAELRTQYLLGYYPANRDYDGKYRKIQVKTTRKDISIRARPGYRSRAGQ